MNRGELWPTSRAVLTPGLFFEVLPNRSQQKSKFSKVSLRNFFAYTKIISVPFPRNLRNNLYISIYMCICSIESFLFLLFIISCHLLNIQIIIERNKGGCQLPEIQASSSVLCSSFCTFLTHACMYVYIHIHAHIYQHVLAPASPCIQIDVVILFPSDEYKHM